MSTYGNISTYPDALRMREARDRFLARNGFRIEDYSAPTFTLKFGLFRVRLPNTKAHRWATPLHDLRHVLTGYQTDWIEEAGKRSGETVLTAKCPGAADSIPIDTKKSVMTVRVLKAGLFSAFGHEHEVRAFTA